MKNRIKLLAISVALATTLSACNSASPTSVKGATEISDVISGPVQNASAKLAFFTFDGQFQTVEGQEIWSLITHFSGEKGLAANAYTVADNDFETTVELAEKSGVELIILWGDTIGQQIQNDLSLSKNVSFILLDADQEKDLGKNIVTQIFSFEQKGWLAGYLAVKNGGTNLACLSMPESTQEQKQSELGFLLGAQAAAEELNLPDKMVHVSVENSYSEQTVQEQLERFAGQGVKTIYVPANQADVKEIESLAVAEQFQYIFADKEDNEELSAKAIFAIDKNIQSVISQLLETWSASEIPFGQVISMGIPEQAFSFSAGETWADISVEEQMQAATEYFTKENILQKLYDEISTPYLQTQTLPLPSALNLSKVEIIGAPQEEVGKIPAAVQSKEDTQSDEQSDEKQENSLVTSE